MADTLVFGLPNPNLDERQGLWGPYWTSPLIGVVVYFSFEGSVSEPHASRTTDGGANWSSLGDIGTGNARDLACWFDQETPGDSGTLVHVVWMDANSSRVVYNTVDVSDGSIGTEVEIDTGVTVTTTPWDQRCGITKTVSGNLIVAFSTQAEVECYRSDDNGATWDDIADVFESATEEDWILLFPAATGDDDDACCLYWDRSEDAISVKMLDNSANSWTEKAGWSSQVDDLIHINMDGAVRHSDGHIIVVNHNNDDDAGDDLEAHEITPDSISSPTVSALTSVATNIAESAQCAVIINQQNDDLYVAYLLGGTWLSSVTPTFTKSDDGGSTWDSPTTYGESADDHRLIHGGHTVGNDGGRIQWAFYDDDDHDVYVNLTNDIEIAAAAAAGVNLTAAVYHQRYHNLAL